MFMDSKTLRQRNAGLLPQPQVEKGCMKRIGIESVHALRYGADADDIVDTHRPQHVIAIDGNERFVLNEEHTQAGRHLFGFVLQSQSLRPACIQFVREVHQAPADCAPPKSLRQLTLSFNNDMPKRARLRSSLPIDRRHHGKSTKENKR